MRDEEKCNYCAMKELKAQARKMGAQVIIRANARIGGVDVYVVPKGEKLDTAPVGDGGKHWKVWLQALAEGCTCE